MSLKFKKTKQGLDISWGGGISLNGKSILDLTYPIGSLYISKENVSPASLFGGTWEQLTADAYFKIVSSNGGNLGGTSSEHKIPIDSMPNHNHTLTSGIKSNDGSTSYVVNQYFKSGWWEGSINMGDSMVGGGQPYYPYYYGVYAWIRIS